MRYIIYTLGCKVNQYETQAIETILQSRGHSPAADGECADAVIVNTCAVTAEAGRKSRQAINRLREENPDAIVAAAGCYSQLSPEWLDKIGADVIFGSNDRTGFAEAIETAVITGAGKRNVDAPFQRKVFEELPAGAASGRTRALLKIQDGCVNFCSYCIIPYTRGRELSLPVDTAAKRAKELEAEGYKELVITGIEIASYGVDLPGKPNLADVVCAIAKAAPNMRLRLGSIEPTVITEEFCRKLADAGTVCPHFHLSLQSGCDKTLKNMNRKYTTAEFTEIVERLRRYFPGCALTTDIIVGFPDETDEDHAQTCAFLEKCAFADIHVFPYSRRPGTVADKMPNQLDRATKARRSKDIRALAAKTHREYLEANAGKTLAVLFETEENGVWQGHSDTYIEVQAKGESLRGIVKNVKITGISGDKLVGEIS